MNIPATGQIELTVLTSLILFTIGIYGVTTKRDILRILISVSIILGSITLLLVTLTKVETGQEIAIGVTSNTISNVVTNAIGANYSFVLFVWAVEVVEIVVALAIFLYLARSGKTDMNELQELKW